MRIDPVTITIQRNDGTENRIIPIGSVSGARYCSRDREAMREKLDAKIARGIAATVSNPSIFRIARYLLTQANEFEVQGSLTGGECEVVAIRQGDEILITAGSDQCDRELDPLFADKPKQMCPHPVALFAWPYAEVRDHWDSLQLYHEVVAGGEIIPVQEFDLSALVDLEFLLSMQEVQSLADPTFLFCGSSSHLESVVARAKALGLPEETSHGVGDEALIRLHDPVLERTIEHRYKAIPVGDDLAERRPVRRE